jgi:hypothetical protein|tara:strand:+ start:954 stop:1094 length:141 start_codon:yes stop_codon:yes gene_type:complete
MSSKKLKAVKWDESHALDTLLNDMLAEFTEEEIEMIIEDSNSTTDK